MILSPLVSFRRLPLVSVVALPCVFASAARADEPEQGPSQRQIESFLSEKPVSPDVTKPTEAPEAPPPPPRRHGFVVESSIGAQTQLGAMRHVSPTSPWFRTAFGWEPTKWIMLLGQFDVSMSSTSLASPPPGPRGYALYAGSVGVRGTISLGTYFGLTVQGEIGGAKISEDVLATYGFRNADTLNPFFGAALGLEWYQVSPHVALGVRGGVRSYGELFDAAIGGASIGWTAAGTVRYVF
jgi:hypothetical protein